MWVNVFNLVASIVLDHSDYDRNLDEASRNTSSFGDKLGKTISAATKIGSAALAAFTAVSVKTGMGFDSAMSQVAATMGTTVDAIGELRDFAMEMGAKTAFSASQAADALNYMALAGYTADESMQALPNVLNLAAAGGIDLARASDMVTDAQSALGLSMEESAELVDKMAMASSKSNTSVAQLGEAILTVGGTAKVLAGGTTELSTALGILADNGVKGAEGGTALRNIILSLSAPTNTAAAAMKSLGLEVFDAQGNLRPLNEAFSDLEAALSTMTQGEQTQVLNTIFNKVDLKSVNALLANTGERFNELAGYIDEASGAADAMAGTQLDNLQGDMTRLQSAVEGLQISLSDRLTPALRIGVQSFTEFVGGVQALNDRLGDFVPAITVAAGAFASFKAGLTIEGAIQGFRNAQIAISVVTANLRNATLAQAALNGTLTVGQTAIALLTGQITLAQLATGIWTKVQLGLNVALTANPVGVWVMAIGTAIAAVTALVLWLKRFLSQSDEVKQRGKELGEIHRGLAKDVNSASDALSDEADSAQKLKSAQDSLMDATLSLSDANNVLSDALAEQEKAGSLSLDTALSLIDAGYSAALSIDTETGAVTLNKDSYTALTQAKIEDQLASLELQKSSIENAARLEVEAQAAGHTESAYWQMAISKAAADKGDTTAIEAQIASLNRLRSTLGTVSAASSAAVKRTSEVSKKAKTQAEKDLEDYKILKAALDHEKAMEIVSDRDYYQKLGELRDRYLTDDSNLDEYRRINEEIYKNDQQLLKKRTESWKNAEETILGLVEEYHTELNNRSREIFNSYKLFEEVPERQKVSGAALMENLRDQIDSIQGFYESVAALEARGAGGGLVDEIRSMGIGAADELAALLSLTDEQLSEYSELYGEKQSLANDIAMEELEGLRAETENQIQENLNAVERLYDERAPEVGAAFTEGLAAGILSGMETVADAMRRVAEAGVSTIKTGWDEHSPSKVAEWLGWNFDKGLSNGLVSGMDMVNRDMAKLTAFDTATIDFASSGLGLSSAAIINSASGAGPGASGPISLTIPVMLPDGSVLAKAMLSDLIKAASAAGTPFTSTGYA